MRTHVVIPKELVETIDRLVGRRLRSKFLAEAAEKEVRRLRLARAAEKAGGALEYWPISREAAQQAGRWRYTYARMGRPLTTTDTLVAAVAQERRVTLVTTNVKDYPMQEVSLLPLKG